MAVHQQQDQPHSPFVPLPVLLGGPPVQAAQTPGPVTAAPGTQAAAPRIEVDPSVFAHMSDAVTVGGVPQRAATTPAVTPAVTPVAGQTTGTAAAVAAPPTVAAYGATLDTALDASILQNRTTRTALNAEQRAGLATAGETETTLNGDRQELLDQLTERSGVYNHDIAAIDAQLGGKIPKNPTAAQQALIAQRTALTTGRDKYKDQQTSLQRWHDRNEINDINTQIADPALTEAARNELLARKRTLATGLLSTTKHYEQFDSRWGDTVYGKNSTYTSMTEAGCGPTAAAILMDFHDQEDPEGQHSRGVADPYTPRRMADYATNHGRVKGSGTSGDVMFNDLAASFNGVQGNSIANRAGATESLNNGIPVAVLGHDIGGSKADGTAASPYGGHFMVLSGVSEDGQTYNVQDGGRNNTRNIHTMTRQQLGAGADGYWNVTSKAPSPAPAT